jgi:hypothetical protein
MRASLFRMTSPSFVVGRAVEVSFESTVRLDYITPMMV